MLYWLSPILLDNLNDCVASLSVATGFDFQQAGKRGPGTNRSARRSLINISTKVYFTLACEKCQTGVTGKSGGQDVKSGHIGRGVGRHVRQYWHSFLFCTSVLAAHGDLGMVTPQDVVTLSPTRESSEIGVALIPVLKRLHVPLICITGRPESSMARAADVHLCVKSAQRSVPSVRLPAPTTSTTATLVMWRSPAVALLKARGFTAEDFALSHPRRRRGRKVTAKA